jgi:hypothetical protein
MRFKTVLGSGYMTFTWRRLLACRLRLGTKVSKCSV